MIPLRDIPGINASTWYNPIIIASLLEIEFVKFCISFLLSLIKILLVEIRKKRIVIPVPAAIGKIQAFFLQMLPKPLLTLDQVRILEEGDNIVSDNNKTFEDLQIQPKNIENIISSYLKVYRPTGQFTD